MTRDEIREALVSVTDGAFIDVAESGEFMIDGAFTLQQLVAIGEVARTALVEPKVGDTIRLLRGDAPWYCTGDFATLKEAAGMPNLWWADFSEHNNPYVHEDGYWCVDEKDFEVVR